MKQWKTTGLFFLLFATWLTLFWVTGSRTPWQMFTPRNQDDGIVVPLGGNGRKKLRPHGL